MDTGGTPLEAFTGSAAFYDALFDPAARLEREEPLLRRLLESAPGERVLDLACGTGHHARLLAEAGGTVTGCDLSADMIAHAASQHEHARLEFRQGDMRTPPGGAWDLVLCVGNSLSLLPKPEDIDTVFQAVAGILAPGGLFFVQVLNYDHETHRTPSHKIFEKHLDDGTRITAVKNLVPQEERTLLSLSFFAEREGTYQSVAESAVLLHPDPAHLSSAALRVGLEIESRYGGYDAAPFSKLKSPDLLMLFGKP